MSRSSSGSHGRLGSGGAPDGAPPFVGEELLHRERHAWPWVAGSAGSGGVSADGGGLPAGAGDVADVADADGCGWRGGYRGALALGGGEGPACEGVGQAPGDEVA